MAAQMVLAIDLALNKLERYYDKQGPLSMIATILDPRKNIAFYHNIGWQIDWINEAISAITDAFNAYQEEIVGNDEQLEVVEDDDDIFESLGKTSSQGHERQSRDELSQFLALNQVNSKVQPLDWWKANESAFPTMAKMAKDYLAAQDSSVPSEEIFSSAADLVTQDRNRLSDTSISKAMCLKYWWKQ